MKQLRHYWNKSWGWLLSGLLTILGFSACDDPSQDSIVYMYGTPSASFSIKGKVVNAANQALPGIQVILAQMEKYQSARPDFMPDYPVMTALSGDTLYTDEKGQFIYRRQTFPSDTVRYELQFYDTDTTANSPHYQADTLKIEFLAKELLIQETGNIWDRGKAEKTITVVLKEEKDER